MTVKVQLANNKKVKRNWVGPWIHLEQIDTFGGDKRGAISYRIVIIMSSLVNKQLQQVAAEDKNKVEKTPQQSMTKKAIPANKGLTRRSMSFEKFLVTAFHIRLACKFKYLLQWGFIYYFI